MTFITTKWHKGSSPFVNVIINFQQQLKLYDSDLIHLREILSVVRDFLDLFNYFIMS